MLDLLQDEFPDITISKIRFLESQGLLDPERTPSGYRKFYEADIERLRWILQQQRENFLPLKVIKERLGEDAWAGHPRAPTRQALPSEARPATGADEPVPIWMTDVARVRTRRRPSGADGRRRRRPSRRAT